MKRFLNYLNPILHLGERKYALLPALFIMLSYCVLSEFYAYSIAKDPLSISLSAIFVPIALIIYLSFRSGIRAGFITVVITIVYYFYIIYTRHYKGAQLSSGIETTIILAMVYFLLAGIIGWLKQTIDELIENEANEKRRLQTIIDQLPAGILITDAVGTLVGRNKQIDKIMGVKIPIGFVIGKDTLKNAEINNAPMNPSGSILRKAISSNKPVTGMEIVYKLKVGKTKFLQVSSAPIHDRNKKIIAAATIVNDITRQKSLEKQKDDFLAVASHELKTPVTSIKAYEQVLQHIFRKKGDKKAVELLKKMDNQLNKLTTLITDLLDVTKIEAGKLQFRLEYFDANTLTREIVEDVQRTTSKHNIITKFAKSKKIYADRERIGQVLTNLLTNAIKYSPKSRQIIVSTRLVRTDFIISVQDFGIGIPKERQARLFKRFYRGEGRNESTYPGLGLGLYISSEIVKRLNGKIWVESVKGKGTTVSFSLPLENGRRK